jgi:cyclophilin family peptidyl-prolyl cis-trans isomerase
MIESLEERKMLAATPVRVTQFYADNRGYAEVFFNQALAPTSLTKKSVRVMSAGGDGQFGTADDVFISRGVGYKKGRLTIFANLPANTRYRIRLGGLRGSNGLLLDGEFNGMGKWTGNGVAGGNFDVTMQTAKNPRARFATSVGYINVGLYKKPTPLTLANFQTYANEKLWDGTFFHRSVVKEQKGIGVIQGGGFNVTNGQVDVVPTKPGIATEGSQSNLKGTIAMANTGAPNSSAGQWFFNVVDNTNLNGGYSVFGKVLDAASQKVVENINKLPIVNATGGDPNSPFGELPVRVQRQNIEVPGDLVMISRVAMMMDVAATPT